MKTQQHFYSKIIFTLLILTGLIFSTEAGAKKLKVKNQMMAYEDMIELANSDQSDRVVFMINGIEAQARRVNTIPKDWILFIEMMNRPKSAFLPGFDRFRGKDGSINICVIKPNTKGEENYRDFEPRFPMHEYHGFSNWIQSRIDYPSSTTGLKQNEERGALIYFTVEADGTLSEFSFDETSNIPLANHLIKVLKSSPRWSPAVRNGMAVRRDCALPHKVWLIVDTYDVKAINVVQRIELDENNLHRLALPTVKRAIGSSSRPTNHHIPHETRIRTTGVHPGPTHL